MQVQSTNMAVAGHRGATSTATITSPNTDNTNDAVGIPTELVASAGAPAARIRLGWCDDGITHISRAVVDELVASTLAEFTVELVPLTNKGLPREGGAWVDLMVCQGFPLDHNLTAYAQLPQRKPAPTANTLGLVWPRDGSVPDLSAGKPLRPLTVAFSGEAWDRGDCRFSMIFTVTTDILFKICPHVFWPSGPRSMFRRYAAKESIQQLLVPPDLDAKGILQSKYLFAAMIVKSCYQSKYTNNEYLLRVIFFHLLSEYKPVFSLGHCKPKVPQQDYFTKASYISKWGADLDGPASMYRPFKFAITFENKQFPGYLTEKPLNAVMGNAIPIYWGDPEPDKIVNTKRMILCEVRKEDRAILNSKKVTEDNYEQVVIETKEIFRESFKGCIQEVIKLDKNDKAFENKLRESIIPGNSINGTYFDMQHYTGAIGELMRQTNLTDRLRRRAQP